VSIQVEAPIFLDQVTILQQAVCALAYLHSATPPFVHRDNYKEVKEKKLLIASYLLLDSYAHSGAARGERV
jgi:hypothetical protein